MGLWGKSRGPDGAAAATGTSADGFFAFQPGSPEAEPAQSFPAAPMVEPAQSFPAAPMVEPAQPVSAMPWPQAAQPVPAGPAPVRPRRGGRWVATAIAVAVVAGLAGGLVAWAPWRVPPVLQPAGLYAGSATVSSASFTWSKPATGPLPDRYLILHDGKVVGSVPGTVTAYRATGLHYGSNYEYQVAAVRGGKRSPVSQFVLVTTATPPVSAARWTGSSSVTITIVSSLNMTGPKHGSYTVQWTASPLCPAGPCAVRLSGVVNKRHFKVTLTRTGGVYTGRAKGDVITCGTGSSLIPVTNTLTFRITLTGAQMDGQVWEAGSWTGTLLVSAPYVSSGTAYCNPFRMNTSLSGFTSAAGG